MLGTQFHLAETRDDAQTLLRDASRHADDPHFVAFVLHPFLQSLPLASDSLGHTRLLASLASAVALTINITSV